MITVGLLIFSFHTNDLNKKKLAARFSYIELELI